MLPSGHIDAHPRFVQVSQGTYSRVEEWRIEMSCRSKKIAPPETKYNEPSNIFWPFDHTVTWAYIVNGHI